MNDIGEALLDFANNLEEPRVLRLSCDRCESVLLVRNAAVQVGDIAPHSNGATWERLREDAWKHLCPPGAKKR